MTWYAMRLPLPPVAHQYPRFFRGALAVLASLETRETAQRLAIRHRLNLRALEARSLEERQPQPTALPMDEPP